MERRDMAALLQKAVPSKHRQDGCVVSVADVVTVMKKISIPAHFPRIYVSWIRSQTVQSKVLHFRLAHDGD